LRHQADDAAKPSTRPITNERPIAAAPVRSVFHAASRAIMMSGGASAGTKRASETNAGLAARERNFHAVAMPPELGVKSLIATPRYPRDIPPAASKLNSTAARIPSGLWRGIASGPIAPHFVFFEGIERIKLFVADFFAGAIEDHFAVAQPDQARQVFPCQFEIVKAHAKREALFA
jgi:hypothetical protein